MTTRADIAKLAGVSESTVSYAISGRRSISEATKARVMAAIEQTGYKANYAAAALASGSPRMVTILTANPFEAQPSQIDGALLDGIVTGVRKSGSHSVIWPFSNDKNAEIEALIKLNFSGGVILMDVVDEDQRVHLLNRANIPFVILGRPKFDFAYNFVDRDFESVYKLALGHLKELGHVNIGVLATTLELNPFLKKVASALKLKLRVISVANTLIGGNALAKNFKHDYPEITGIISLLDYVTTAFVDAAAQYGLSIPRDLSIIGVNILEEQAESASPKISTIAFNAFEMAESCGKIMVEVIAADKNMRKKKSELWVGDFVDRGSTRAISQISQ